MLRYIITFTAIILLPFIQNSKVWGQESTDSLANSIRGVVLDSSTGLPIEGAQVLNSKDASTFSDEDGNFTLQVESFEDIITISASSYAKQIIPLKERSKIEVQLHEEGYTSFQREVNFEFSKKPLMYVTQAVESMNFEDKNWNSPGTSSDHLMKGSFAGLQVQNRSGLPANGALLTLRGINSLHASNAPLIIVDGMISEFNSKGKNIISGAELNTLAGININDIEEITILKDATSIYGAQGANGVIYIHTIQATEAKTKIELSTYAGISYKPKNYEVLKSDGYKALLSDLLQTSGISQDSIASLPYMNEDIESEEYNMYHNETNWQDESLQDGVVENFNLKIKGGDNIALYGLSVGYMSSEGIVKNTDYQRYSIRFNTNIKISSKVSCLANISWSSGVRNLNDDGIGTVTNPLHLSLQKAPFLHPNIVRAGGVISPNYEDADIFGISNPVALVNTMEATQRNNASNASIKLNYDINDRLQLTDRVGIMFYKSRFNTFVPHVGVADYDSYLATIENTMQNKVESKYTVFNDLRLRYELIADNSHSFNIMGGLRHQINKTQEDWAEAFNSPNDEMRSIGNGVNSLDEIGGYIGNWNLMTYYANLDYDYRKKYFVTLGASLDGSSQYGSKGDGVKMNDNIFGFFPSATAAWLLSSESFMHNADFVSIAKLRLGASATGNNDIGYYSAQRYYSTQNLMGAFGLVSDNIYNPSLQWEDNLKINIGLDLGLFNDRVSLGFDAYRNYTSNMLTYIKPVYQTGYSSYLDNVGGLETNGIDFTANARIINKDLKWDIGVNLNKYKTTVSEYAIGNEVFDVFDAQVLVSEGEELGLFYGYKTKGILSSDAAAQAANLTTEMANSDLIPFTAGDVYFKDIDGNNIINEDDKQVIGNPTPDIAGNVFTNVSYKGLSLDLTFSFSYGNDVYNHLRRNMESMTNYTNQSTATLNRWRVQGQETNIPKANYGDLMGNSRFSDRWIEDGSYIRLREVTLSYKIPLPKHWSQTIMVFATGQNLLTFSNYLGMDPEFSAGASPLYRGIDIGLSPQSKAIFGGIKIGL